MVAIARFTISEVATHFGVSERYLSQVARKNRLCGKAGKSLYFTQSDIEALDQLWHDSGSTKEERSGGSTGPSMASASERARARLFGKTPSRSPVSGNARSTNNRSSDQRQSSPSARQLATT